MDKEKAAEAIAKGVFDALKGLKKRMYKNTILSDIRPPVLEIHGLIEEMMDRIILRRYVLNQDVTVVNRVNDIILSKLSYSSKIEIIKKIQKETGLELFAGKIAYLNALRNALVHNYSAEDKIFNYRGGHIIKDLKIDEVFEDMIKMICKLGDAYKTIQTKQESARELLLKRISERRS